MAKYKADHVRVLKALGSELPDRPSMTTEQIVSKTFRRCENADRRVRNAYRMIRAAKHATIVKRGLYRLTASGAAFVEQLLSAPTSTGKKKGKKKQDKQKIKPRATRPRKKIAAKAQNKRNPIPVVERTLTPERAPESEQPAPAPKPKGNNAPQKPVDTTASLSF
jgi:hypothetical protein